MTGYEKIDHFYNQLKSLKHTIKSIYLIFIKKYVSGVFCNITSKLLKVKISADLS